MVRLRQRSSEVLPDWAGPMTPKISLRLDVEGDAVDHLLLTVGEAQVPDVDLVEEQEVITISSGSAARRAR